MNPEEIIRKYRIGRDSRVKFKNDPQTYWVKNISPDRKNLFVHINGAQTYRKAIKNLVRVGNVDINENQISQINLLLEIGDTTQGYQLNGGDLKPKGEEGYYQAIYRFTTDNGTQYKVQIDAYDTEDDNGSTEMMPFIEVGFYTKEKGYQAIGNLEKREVFKIMATVTNAVKDFINKHDWVEEIHYSPSESVKQGGEQKKRNLYQAYIQKAFPGSNSFYSGGRMRVKIRESIDTLEIDNVIDTITLDVPLFIRLLEYAREDAQTDMDLHNVADKAIKLGLNGGVLTMKNYNQLI
jgi:hypothetical protein